MEVDTSEDVVDKEKQEFEILQRLNARRSKKLGTGVTPDSSKSVHAHSKTDDVSSVEINKSSVPDGELGLSSTALEREPTDGDSDVSESTDESEDESTEHGGDFTVLEEVERAGRQKVHRVLPDWLAQPQHIGVDQPIVKDFPGLAQVLQDRLEANGVKKLFPVQAAVLPYLLQNHLLPPCDLCVSAPTGSGKTLAFVLPLVQALQHETVRRVRALIVLPTQPLAAQVAAVCRQYADGDLKVILLGADTIGREQKKLVRRGPRGWLSLVDVVVSTPGRLMDHISDTEGFSLAYLRYLVIDEADRVIEMAESGWLAAVEAAAEGTDDPMAPSRRSLTEPVTAASLWEPHLPLQKLLFSATLSQNPEKLQRLRLFQPKLYVSGKDAVPLPGKFSGKFTTPAELTESCLVIPIQLKPLVLHHLLRKRRWKRVLVFANSNEAAHRLTLLLVALKSAGKKDSVNLSNTAGVEGEDGGVKLDSLDEACQLSSGVAEFSGAVPGAQRRRSLAAFSAGQVQTLICSDAMARGMDVEAVDAVISYDIPALVKTYVHRVGRTARAGQPGQAVTILVDRQKGHFERLLAEAGKTDQVSEETVSLSKLRKYEDAYMAALKAVNITVESEKQVEAAKLRGKPKTAVTTNKRKRSRVRRVRKKGSGARVDETK